ncbi:MAG: 2'-deoxycytidine 5'-triphosphate deaminase [Caulobacterales bacterium]|nr:2'-deoxycytidine 5'-triphosphate deaminase [Caulobacterales bacterium]
MAQAGILCDLDIEELARAGAVASDEPLASDQIQPASLDVRLGATAYRVRASFLPGHGRSVGDRLTDQRLVMHRINLASGAVLETGCVYLATVAERLALPPDVEVAANPKSSTGRLDVFTRVIADGADSFDRAPHGYTGPLYVEISPRTFSVLVRAGDRLSQLRFRRGAPAVEPRTQTVRVDLSGADTGLLGFRARRHAGVVDLDRVEGHDPRDYWEPLRAREGALVLDPGEFYILASKEAVRIDPGEAAEMIPIAPEIGEFRAHYAGFFDPGFGCVEAGGDGGRAVLEVRGRDVPFILEDGQPAARLMFEPLTRRPKRLYGEAGSHYQAQGLKLGKHFRAWEE